MSRVHPLSWERSMSRPEDPRWRRRNYPRWCSKSYRPGGWQYRNSGSMQQPLWIVIEAAEELNQECGLILRLL